MDFHDWNEVRSEMPKLTIKKHELPGRDVFEIMKGTYKEEHWLEDSIYITEDDFQKTEMKDLLDEVVFFHYYGPTEIDQTTWEVIKKNAAKCSDLTRQLISEIDEWAKECFKEKECFTICGI
jgi:hypothetical protein